MRGLCKSCKQRNECIELCTEAYDFATQDQIDSMERDLVDKDVDGIVSNYGLGPIYISSPEQLKQLIIDLRKDGLNAYQISYHLPCSRRYVRQVLGKEK